MHDTVPSKLQNLVSRVPIVDVDSYHDFVGEHTGNSFPPIQKYAIPPGSGIVLNTSSFELRVPPRLVSFNISRPNRVDLYVRLGHYANGYVDYYANWDHANKSIALNAETLVPVSYPSKPFSGFQSGQEVTIYIGFYDKGGLTVGPDPSFWPFWGAVVDIQ